MTRMFHDDEDFTETLELSGLFSRDVTSSGSFTGIHRTWFGRLLNTLPIPVLLIDRFSNIIYANQSCAKISADYERILGKPFSRFFSDTSAAKNAESLVKKVFLTRKRETGPAELRIGAGTLWGRMYLRSIRMGKNRLVLVLVEDLTAEKSRRDELEMRIRERTAELHTKGEALRESEEKYRLVVEKAPTGVIVIQDDDLKLVNSRFCDITGYAKEELTLTRFRRLIDPDDGKMVSERREKRRRGDAVPEFYSLKVRRKDGSVRWVELTEVMIDWEGRPGGLNFVTDVTQKRRMEEELQRVQKLESLATLAGGIAHDFNNILTAIQANISAARICSNPDGKGFKRLQQAEGACIRAGDLTHQLLIFAKGGAPIKKTAAVSDIITDSCNFALRGSNVRCEFSLSEDIWTVVVDEAQFSRVVGNIVMNADQAMPEGGVIGVSAGNLTVSDGHGLPLQPADYVRISLEDQGVGMDAEILPKIFDPYFTTRSDGSGLGLYAAYSIIKGHDGLITVESTPGVGSTFYIFVPASRQKAPPRPATDEGLVTGTGKILLMDDEASIRDVAAELLSMLGYEVDTARDGAEAVDLYRSGLDCGRPFDAVILDLTVPGGMGGKEAMKRLLEIDPNVTAIVSSGYSHDPIMAEHREYGFQGVMPKPYAAPILSRILAKVIDNATGSRRPI